MLSKLNCKQSFPQAIIVLLFFLGITPNTSYGRIKCYSCDGDDCNSKNQTKNCDEANDNVGYCITSGTPGSIKRDCCSITMGSCVRHFTRRDCYYSATDRDKALLEKINECISANNKARNETSDLVSETGATCVCGKDGCNFGDLPPPIDGNQGSVPNVKCYVCKGDNTGSCWKLDTTASIETKICGGCFLEKDKQQVKRQCVDKAAAQCAIEHFRDGCLKLIDTEEARIRLYNFNLCTYKTSDFDFIAPQTYNVAYCGCLTDSCNLAGRIFVNGHLIFAGTLAVFYVVTRSFI